MPNTYLDKAIEAVPKFEERISLFTKKLLPATHHEDHQASSEGTTL